jgi:3-methyladenine DNA glycosylase AlkD
MEIQEVLDTLKSLGKEQTRKIYRRHGAGENVYGVNTPDLKNLQKKLKKQPDLAPGLWATGNHEARVLATMIADPSKLDAGALDAWAASLDGKGETSYLAGIASKSPAARQVMERWIDSGSEWIASAGWVVLALLAMAGQVSDADSEAYLARIERDLHASPNRVRHEMNMALIAIGGSNPALEAKAVAAAKRIGKVEVDHGETDCKTPEAVSYIQKMVERRRAKAS